MDWGKPFVTATYLLEGDCPLALECYEKIKTVRLAIRTAHTPNVDAIARRLSDSADRSLLQRPSLLHVLEDQLQTSHYNNLLFSLEQLAYNLDWIILKGTLILVLKMHFQNSKLPGTSHP